MTVIVVTCNGQGRAYKFDTPTAADNHPLTQLGDLVMCSCADMQRAWTEDEIESRLRRYNAGTRPADLWSYIVDNAPKPPSDPAEICARVIEDRKTTRKSGILLYKSAQASYDLLRKNASTQEFDVADAKKNGGGKAAKSGGVPAAAKAPSAPKAAKVEKIGMGQSIIRMKADKEGKLYGVDNNPKRPTAKNHGRFALYKDGMTIDQFVEAGGHRADVPHDVGKGFISLEPPKGLKEAAAS